MKNSSIEFKGVTLSKYCRKICHSNYSETHTSILLRHYKDQSGNVVSYTPPLSTPHPHSHITLRQPPSKD